MTEEDERNEIEDTGAVGRIHLVLLKLTGLVTFEGRGFNFIPTIVAFVYVHCSHLIVSSMYLCGTLSNLRRKKGNIDIQIIAETIGLCGVHARYLLMFAKRGKIAHILGESRRLWQQLTTDEEKLIRKFVAKSSKLAKLYVLINFAMWIFYLTASQLPLFAMRSDESFNRSLPYVFYTEVDENSVYFAPAVIIQMLSMIGICFSTSGVDNTAPFLIMLTCAHFRILCTRLNLLQQSTNKVSEADIVKCILYHQNIIAFCKEIEQLLSPVFLVQLLSSTYNIAIVALKLVDDDSDKFKYATVLVIMLIQLFVCQWAPDLLVTESDALIKSTYFSPESNDDYNAKTMKLMHMVTMRAQYSVHIKAGGYVNLSMEAFGSMIKGIVSFFTVLRSFG